MGRRFVWLSVALAALAACSERLTAPAECPEFCPPTLIDVVDTVITGVIARDSAFRGYVEARSASALPLVRDGDTTVSRAVLRFFGFPDSLRATASDPVLSPVVSVDSLRLRFALQRFTDLDGIALTLHRLPIEIDSTTTMVDVEPFFDDSTVVATIPIPDTLATDTVSVDTVAVIIMPSAFPTFAADSGQVALGVVVQGVPAGFIDISSVEGTFGPVVTRFVTLDSAQSGTEVRRTDARQPRFDTYFFTPPAAPAGDVLVAGGAPSARSLLRVELPSPILDSTQIVRATLLIVPAEPNLGAPADTFLLRVEALSADFGPKSPLLGSTLEDLLLGTVDVVSGSMDTIRVDITHIMRPWQQDAALPRSFMIRVVPEGAGLGEVRVGSSREGAAPGLHLTYIPIIGGQR